MRTSPNKQHVVYYIGVRDENTVKIGTTANLTARLRSLASARADGGKLVVLATEPGTYKLEAQRHTEFADSRKHGEWFELTPALQAHIDRLTEYAHPAYVQGYDAGYLAALSDRDVVTRIACSECSNTEIPAWDARDYPEPCDICVGCYAERQLSAGQITIIRSFMHHLGWHETPEGAAKLPPLVKALYSISFHASPEGCDSWEEGGRA